MQLARSLVVAALAALAIAGCGGCSDRPSEQGQARRPDEPRPAAPVGSVEPVAPAAPARLADSSPGSARPPPSALPADLAPDCVAYAELIDKLKACTQLGGARDAFTRSYESLRSAWTMVPPERRDEVAAQCKTQAESLRSAAAATCAW